MQLWLYVFLGGGAGSVARYGINRFFSDTPVPLYIGTFIANFLACFILGMLISFNMDGKLSDQRSLFLMTGFCGGFSTFSTFSSEALELLSNEMYLQSAGYILGSVLLGLIAVYLGIKAA